MSKANECLCYSYKEIEKMRKAKFFSDRERESHSFQEHYEKDRVKFQPVVEGCHKLMNEESEIVLRQRKGIA